MLNELYYLVEGNTKVLLKLTLRIWRIIIRYLFYLTLCRIHHYLEMLGCMMIICTFNIRMYIFDGKYSDVIIRKS
jgi:hypothetical protein